MGKIEKIYLGDAVYAEWKNSELILTTEDGISITNKIYLEIPIIMNLLDYIRKVDELYRLGIEP